MYNVSNAYRKKGVCYLLESLEQRKVLETWETLTDKEKLAVKTYVRGMKLE